MTYQYYFSDTYDPLTSDRDLFGETLGTQICSSVDKQMSITY